MPIDDNVFSIGMRGNERVDHMNIALTSGDGLTFVAVLNNSLEIQPSVGGFMSRADALRLQAYLTTVLG